MLEVEFRGVQLRSGFYPGCGDDRVGTLAVVLRNGVIGN